MAGRILAVFGEIVVNVSALMRVADFVQHLGQIAILLFGRLRRVPQHSGGGDGVVFARFQEIGAVLNGV